jgi:pimeloyl-ACP methyl ester carboxylesterase
MQSEYTVQGGATLSTTAIGTPKEGGIHLVWGHGWGQSAAALIPLAESLKPFASSSLIDFPGFGQSPKPADSWGTAEYADLVAGWMRTLAARRTVWIGHSFGGRVGLQLAARHPDLLSGMVLIASAGLRRRRSVVERLRVTLRRKAFKTARRLLREGPQLDRLRQRFGSSDYRAAGAMRPILTRVVGEDLTEVARSVRCRTLLIYGTADTETPPEIGQRFKALIPDSELVLLNGFGHLSVLSEGCHQVVLQIRKFLEALER